MANPNGSIQTLLGIVVTKKPVSLMKLRQQNEFRQQL
jgi:hypothetical protein